MRGFTLLEVLLVLVIVVFVAALVLPNYGQWLARAQEARCISNLRSLHVGLGSYLNDNQDVWPQGPPPEADAEWSRFWITTLEPYGVTLRTWQCPTILGMIRAGENDGQFGPESIHYIPTMFDPTPGVARRWPTQPWLVERADAHGNGALLLFTDGSIKSFFKVLAEQGMR